MTILFTDLVGSTARAEGLDPEDVRATLSAYYAQLRAELERHGGTVEKFIGDAVMAVFGAPVAHEDDAGARGAGGARDPRLDRRGAPDPHRDQHRRGARRARRAAGRGRRDGGRRRRQHGGAAAGRGAGQRHPRRRGDLPRDAAT